MSHNNFLAASLTGLSREPSSPANLKSGIFACSAYAMASFVYPLHEKKIACVFFMGSGL